MKNNKNNCYLLINGKKIDLYNEIFINEEQKENLEIKLIETKIITNMSYMFYKCSSLQSLPDISKWDTKNVTNMSFMFSGCSSLQSLPDISKWDTKNVTDMSWMFYNCGSLQSLPDISNWDINKNLKRESMFDGVDKKLIPKKFQ